MTDAPKPKRRSARNAGRVTARKTPKVRAGATAIKIAATPQATTQATTAATNQATTGARPQATAPAKSAVSPGPVLSSAQRSELRGRAHHLDPVVMIGDAGLSGTVMAEIERALNAHELIKIRVHGDDRAARLQMLTDICAQAACAPIQTIGKLLIVWRKAPDPITVGKSDIAIARKLKAVKAKANRAKAVKVKRKMARSKSEKAAPVKRWYSAGKAREQGSEPGQEVGSRAGSEADSTADSETTGARQPQTIRARRITRSAR